MTIRRQPADFLVEERPSADFLASLAERGGPRAPHAVYALTKESLTTPDAAGQLARALRVGPGAVSYAGLKDRHARTTQYVSVRATGPLPDFAEGVSWQARRCGWASEPLGASNIDGNRFTIVVRDLTEEAAVQMRSRAELLTLPGGETHDAARGDAPGPPGAAVSLAVVNYFGDQRFGSARHGKGFAARRLIEGDFEGALKLLIGTPARKDSGRTRAFTRVCAGKWGRWAEMLAELPGVPERAAVERLASGGGFREAFEALPAFTRVMCVEAYQSHLWNVTARLLAERVAREGGVDPLRAPDEFGEMVFPPAGALSEPWLALIVPLLGPTTALEEPWGSCARAALEAEGIGTASLRIPGVRRPFFGEAPRPLLGRVDRFSLSTTQPDELGRPGRLRRTAAFDLGRGAYATVVLRALGQ